ncbi:MAG: chromate transporter [Chloroflexi bacterium]|nr:chromate transporter [Chloroflexota bacterium]
MRRAKQANAHTLIDLAKAWLTIGSRSIGGGPSSLYLMRRELVERRGWLTHREFVEDWALSKVSLGINQIALAGLEGIRVAGSPGLAVTLAAFLIPSGLITALMTAGYEVVRSEPWVKAALNGVGPVVAGMTLAMALTFAQGAWRRGRAGVFDRAYWLLAVAVGLLALAPQVAVLGTGIAAGLLFMRGETSRAQADPGA